MNFSKHNGWYYLDLNSRSPSWTDVDYLFSFLINNKGKGPFGEEINIRDIQLGDIIQLSFELPHDFNHSLVVVKTGTTPDLNNIEIATHTIDRDNYPLKIIIGST